MRKGWGGLLWGCPAFIDIGDWGQASFPNDLFYHGWLSGGALSVVVIPFE
ncbi:hypothetical protein [Zymomonas mobilis]|nr:hypothetical protein [Zymomonas mobilis]